jgi:hypothetical protein
VAARTWLAAVGWRRRGLIGLDEAPASGRTTRRAGSRSSFRRAVPAIDSYGVDGGRRAGPTDRT